MKTRSAVREYALALVLGAAGAGLVWLAARGDWARVVTPAQGPLPASSVAATGQSLVPVAPALGLAALAGLAGVIATRGIARRVMGVVLAAFAVAIAVAVSVHVSAAAVQAAVHTTPLSAGSTTSGDVPGASRGAVAGLGTGGHVVMTGAMWRAVAVVGAAAVLAAGLLVIWRGGRWPAMSSRYDAPGGARPARRTDSAGMWDSLSMGEDPTDQAPPLWEGAAVAAGDGGGAGVAAGDGPAGEATADGR